MKSPNTLDISFYHINLFLTLAKEKNFIRAAERLHITQPALTKRIQVLEESIGTPLFVRGKRPIELTTSGEYLKDAWSNLVDDFEKDINFALQLDNKIHNKLTVGAMDSASRLIPMEKAYQELNINSDVHVVTEYVPIANWIACLKSGAVDIMIALSFELPFIDDDIEYEVLYSAPLLACMSKNNPLAKRKSIRMNELRDCNFIFNSPQIFPDYCKYYTQLCYENGFGPKIVRYVNNAHSLIWNIQSDDEVVICDEYIRDINTPLISHVKIKNQTSELIAFWKKGDSNPLIRMYIDSLKRNFTYYESPI